MIEFRAFSSVLLVASCISSSPSLASDCAGDTRQEHHLGNFNFVTSSWVEKAGKRRTYVSCVGNLDPNSDLPVDWIIPGPHGGYVPDDEARLTGRLEDDTNPRPIDGCLKYGPSHAPTVAQFLGTAEDEKRNKTDANCRPAPTSVQDTHVGASGLPTEPYTNEIRIFFPSDPSRPRETMLEVTGRVGIEPEGNTYTSSLVYHAHRYKGRPDGQINDVLVQPGFPVSTDAFMQAYSASNKPSYVLREKDRIAFTVQGSANHIWRTVRAYYLFTNRDRQFLAAIPMPLLEDTGK
jgi:hypothetical protein